MLIVNYPQYEELPYLCFSPKENTDNVEDFIFVHQTAWQHRLMAMDGSEMCVMDATYNVCKCEVALFFVCVHMNVGYIIVGCFLLPSDSVSDISRGLRILRQLNPSWNPAFFMTDYDQKEISVIETVFPGK